MEISTQTMPLSIFKILQESIKLLTKSSALIISIFFLDLLSSYLLYFFNHFSISPLLSDLVHNTVVILLSKSVNVNFYDLTYAIRKDTRELIIIQFIFQIIAFTISSVITIAAIHVLACKYTYFDNLLTPMDVLAKLRRTFRGPMITKLYIGIFHLGYSSLTLVLIVVLLLFYSPKSALFIVSSIILGLMVLLLLSYLAIVWYVSVVISTVEEGCYGLVAIGKAAKLVRGRRMQGTLLIFIEMVVITIIQGAYFRFMVYFHYSSTARLVLGLIYIGIYLAMNMIIWATSTIFYCECMRIRGKITEIAMDRNQAYSSLSTITVPHVDEASSKLLLESKC